MRYKMVIFDVDGTLLDTSPGIFNSVRFAEKMMGFAPIQDEYLAEFVGPPPKEMYMKIYGVDEETALEAAKYHRQYGREKAIYEAKVYPGIEVILSYLKNAGYKLGVSTLKSESIVNLILQYYGLLGFFDVVVGMDPDETRTKADTINIAVEHTGCQRNKCLMVGDSMYDLEGAKEACIDFLGVTYGFGFYRNQKDIKLADNPMSIKDFIINANK